jgi:hypothetical protein
MNIWNVKKAYVIAYSNLKMPISFSIWTFRLKKVALFILEKDI